MPKPSEQYHVFELTKKGVPSRELTKQPLPLEAAKAFARIGATEGSRARAVVRRPKSKTQFHVAAVYSPEGKNVTREWKKEHGVS